MNNQANENGSDKISQQCIINMKYNPVLAHFNIFFSCQFAQQNEQS